jgi:F1F0 ATPase subunit 2
MWPPISLISNLALGYLSARRWSGREEEENERGRKEESMTEVVTLTGSLATGLIIGVVYFGGLWLTMRAVSASKRPRLLTAVSFIGRLAVAGLGFYLLSAGGWQRPVVAIAGFILMRLLLARRWGPDRNTSTPENGQKPAKEVFERGNRP